LLEKSGLRCQALGVQRVEHAGTEWRVFGEHSELRADAVIVAVGGVAAGGIVLGRDLERGRHGFRLAIELPARLVLDGDLADEQSSLFGPTLEVSGFGALERVGIELGAGGLVRGISGQPLPGLSAAGDCVAGRPRSLLEAVRSGIAAVNAVLAKL
jgi:glycerol-3-phosphate dehydrogenase subunit B